MSKKTKDKKNSSINSTNVSESLDNNNNESSTIDVLIDDSLIETVSKDEVEEIEKEIVSSIDTNESTNEIKSSSSDIVDTTKENKKVKNKKKKKRSKSSIFLYLISILFLGYLCFNIYDTYKYIAELISYGSIDPSTQAKEIVSYYVGTCSPYAFYSIATWALGLMLSKITEIKNLIKIEK